MAYRSFGRFRQASTHLDTPPFTEPSPSFGHSSVLYPHFRFVVDERLKPNGVAFRINYLTTLPILCPRPDQCLVNDTVERLRLMKVEGLPTTNPATWQPGA